MGVVSVSMLAAFLALLATVSASEGDAPSTSDVILHVITNLTGDVVDEVTLLASTKAAVYTSPFNGTCYKPLDNNVGYIFITDRANCSNVSSPLYLKLTIADANDAKLGERIDTLARNVTTAKIAEQKSKESKGGNKVMPSVSPAVPAKSKEETPTSNIPVPVSSVAVGILLALTCIFYNKLAQRKLSWSLLACGLLFNVVGATPGEEIIIVKSPTSSDTTLFFIALFVILVSVFITTEIFRRWTGAPTANPLPALPPPNPPVAPPSIPAVEVGGITISDANVSLLVGSTVTANSTTVQNKIETIPAATSPICRTQSSDSLISDSEIADMARLIDQDPLMHDFCRQVEQDAAEEEAKKEAKKEAKNRHYK